MGHIEKQLGYLPVAAEQIALADLIILSKTDLLPEGKDAETIEARIHGINPAVPIIQAVNGAVENSELFQERRFFAAPEVGREHDDHDHASHTAGISSVVLRTEKPIDIDRLYAWIGELQNTLGPNLLRYKGILATTEWPDRRAVLQGVHTLYTIIPERVWRAGEQRQSTLVVIGQEIDAVSLQQSFDNFLSGKSAAPVAD